MTEQGKVSVCLCVYNGARSIGDTIKSVLAQTYENLEVIIVDDASTDQSSEIIDSFEDSRIKKIYLEKNRNVCNAGNVALENATGEYFAIIGHDDIWCEDKIEKQVRFLEENPQVVGCFTRVDIINEKNEIINEKITNLNKVFHTPNMDNLSLTKYLLLKCNIFCAPSSLLRKAILDEIGLYRYSLVQLQDYELWLRMLKKGDLYVLEEPLTKYRVFQDVPSNLSSATPQKVVRIEHEQMKIFFDYIQELTDQEFMRLFGDLYQESVPDETNSEYELRCKKGLLLCSTNNCMGFYYMMHLMEDDICRSILENKYGYTLIDFYEYNTKPVLCDTTYKKITEMQENIIKELQNINEQKA